MSIKFTEFIQKRLIELGSLVIIFISIGFFIFLLNYSPVAEEISKQEYNLIEALKTNCRKTVKEKTGKRPYTNINLVRI